MKHRHNKKLAGLIAVLGIVLVAGLICIPSINEHWTSKNCIRDNPVPLSERDDFLNRADPADDTESDITEGNVILTGLVATDEAMDHLSIGDSSEYFEITPESAGDFTGCAFTSRNHHLARGAYSLTVNYSTDTDGSYAMIYAADEMNADAEAGSAGAVIAKIPLDASESSVTVSFDLTSNHHDIYVQIYYEGGTLQLKNTEINQTGVCTDQIWNLIFLLIAISVLGYLLLFRYQDESRRNDRILVAVLVGAIVYLCVPLMNDFLLYGHDIKFHLGRVDGIAQALENGTFPMWINMSQTDGYGYCTPIMYPQLFLYIPAILMTMGMSLMNAYKILLCCINIAGVLIAYFSFRGVLKSRAAALASALCYTLCIYRIGDLYTREALGEALGMVFLPLIFYGLYEIYVGNEKKWIYLVLGVTGTLSSHILSVMMAAVFAGLFFLILLPKILKSHPLKRILSLLKAGVVTVLLNLYFLVPFMDYYLNEALRVKHESSSGLVVNATGLYFSELFGIFLPADSELSDMAYGSTRGEMTLSLGLLIGVALLVFIWIRFFDKKHFAVQESDAPKAAHQRLYLSLGTYCLVGALIAIFLSCWVFPWIGLANLPIVNKLKSIQHVWRFLAVADVFASVLLGCLLLVLADYRKKWKKPLCAIAIAAAFFCSLYYMDSTTDMISYYDRTLVNEIGGDTLYLYDDTDGVSDAEARDIITVRSSVDGTMIQSYSRKDSTVTFSYTLPEGTNEAELSAPLYYYPGYTAVVDGTEQEVYASDSNLATVHVTQNSGTVTFTFTGKRSWWAAYVVSFITLILLAGGGITAAVIRNKKKKQSAVERKR